MFQNDTTKSLSCERRGQEQINFGQCTIRFS